MSARDGFYKDSASERAEHLLDEASQARCSAAPSSLKVVQGPSTCGYAMYRPQALMTSRRCCSRSERR